MQVGTKLTCLSCQTEVIVVRSSRADVVLVCHGGQMRSGDGSHSEAAASPEQEQPGETLVGKRYFDQETGLEVLCVKSGGGPMTVEDRPLAMMGPRHLPASD